MPGIVVFKRRWMVASDDFVIPFGIAFFLRGLWMIVLSLSVGIYHGFYHAHRADEQDKHICEQTLDYFVGGYLALLFATNIMELSIAWMSGKGSITDTEPRNLIPQLLYVRLVLSIIELLWLSIGIKWIFLDSIDCKLTSEIYIARAIVVFNWLFLFTVTVIIYCTFDSAGRTWVHLHRAQLTGDSVDASDSYSTHIARKYEQRWEGCFKRFFCCSGAGKGNENVYTFIGRTLSEYFQDLDIVPSDFAAGLVLLRKQQKRQEHRALMAAIEEQQVQVPESDSKRGVKKSSLRYQRTNSARTLNLKDKSELLLFKDIVYYMNYALSAYGWPIYMKNNVSCGCCRLCKSFRCCYPCRRPDERSHKFVDVESDNCCRCNFSALKRIALLHNRDIIYASYHNKLYETPFFVSVDHLKKAIVVTIRGTLSLQDILTDFSVEAEKIPLEDGDPNWFGHKGMIKAALYIKRKLENGILATAFGTHPEKGTHTYRLLLVGHSLGAGTAAILAMLLRPTYPDLFCYAYSPPGANLSLSAAKYARDFVISVVVGKDMIPRLSLYTLEDLRNKIMAVISYSTTPKWKILRGCACRCAFVCCYGCKCVNCDAQLRDTEADWERFELPSNKNSKSPNFYPPGRVIHVVKTVSVPGRCGRKRPMFEPVWADSQDFQSIQISGLMWEDHMPDFVLEALNHCLPSKEQEESVLSAPEPSCSNTLEVPSTGFVEPNHVLLKREDTLSLVEADAAGVVDEDQQEKAASIDSLALAVGHPLWRTSALSTDTNKAPIARPESGFEDSELDESAASSRVSSTWKGYNLPSVQQSTDNIIIDMHPYPRPRASTDSASLSSKRSSKSNRISDDKATSAGSIPERFAISRTKSMPPPKPPRTFETERSEERPSVKFKPPPKPPRTFEYDSQVQANFSSSLYWNFPRPRDHRYQTQVSLPGHLDGSLLSTDSIDGASEEILPPYSPHRKRRSGAERPTSQAEETLSPVDNDKHSLLSKTPAHRNVEVLRRHRPDSDVSSGPQSRFSVSDSGLNVSPEEVLLLGSVKPRTGRRRRNQLKQATSETLHCACSGTTDAGQSADPLDVRSVPHLDANFLETML